MMMMAMVWSRTSFLFFLGFLLCVAFGDNPDKIIKLPGAPSPLPFNQYAGYITVDEVNGRNLFYWFVESQKNPVKDKLVLWLNGGPGCSSLGGGLMTELGPFRPNSDGNTLSLNPNSWNTVANVIFLESPAGVGFSYSNTKSDYTVGDDRTANDTYVFLLKFFDRYPQYQGRAFWITGESYGGHYVPQLANRILQGNAEGKAMKINLEGIMVGNAWTYSVFDNRGAVDYWYTHALISNETYQGIINNCDFGKIGPLKGDPQDQCDMFVDSAFSEMGNINIYDIYVDVCLSRRQQKYVEQLGRAGSRLHRALASVKINPPYQPCIDEYTNIYMNAESVKAAIHAKSDITWSMCSPVINYSYDDLLSSVIPLYNNFANKLRVLVYSGDVDAIVPISGTRQWMFTLGRKVTKSWKPYMVEKQVGGYVVEYDGGLTFASVRNAGHMVPETQPERALYMFSQFLAGNPL
jgi:serine carboxypeptidase-like clade 2